MSQRMKRIGSLATIVALFALSVGLAPRVMADIITDQQINAIRTRCVDIQAVLNRVHQSDTLLRYNRGPLYRLLSDKLMTPLNQRIATNQLDGGNLSKIAADYNLAYKDFVDAYRVYEVQLSATMAIDCEKQPTIFYDNLMKAGAERDKLHKANVKLVTLAKEFQADVLLLKKKVVQDE